MSGILERLRETDVKTRAGTVRDGFPDNALGEFIDLGVKFVSSHPKIENVYYRAVRDLMNCVAAAPSGGPMLLEGADFIGMWLESTGTISAELFSRFCPETARSTMELFADHKRADGLIPYKITASGPAYRQVQMVTPLARSVWDNYVTDRDKAFLKKMYEAIADNDKWLETYRNTRGTGCVEAFCAFDTGCDASPRFWHAPDTPYMNDPARYDPNSPILPFLAPDMTANVYCQRKYLAKMAEELGLSGREWENKAEGSLKSLMKYCYDEKDHYFYDCDKLGRFVRVQTDNLIRVYAAEAGTDEMFEDALNRYFLNTKKYFPRYPITTVAIDEPGFSPFIEYNSWAGQVSFLTETRLPRAFDYHRRFVELTWIMHPIITALSRFTRFAGSLNAWVGAEGYRENYSPTMLCVLDYLERFCGIFPTPENELIFTSLIPYGIDYGESVAEETGYARSADGAMFELVNTGRGSVIYKNGEPLYGFPLGVRVVTDRTGALRRLVGASYSTVSGSVVINGGGEIPFEVRGNEVLEFTGGGFESVFNPGVVPPNYGGRVLSRRVPDPRGGLSYTEFITSPEQR
ncbi:MAG: hypothetical protein LBS84_03155 [Clostridiales bacterium]|jgi:hypothetical protein|nr:hypothetical protein [Clostridiales bacterium]